MRIVCKGICKGYAIGKQPKIPVLRNLDATFMPGQITALVGVSGSGKTTFLDMLTLNTLPDSGTVLFDGTDIFALSEQERARFRRENVGYVTQDLGLLSILTAEENIRLPQLIAGKTDTMEGLFGEGLFETREDPLEIADCLHKFPHEMSGGQCQRVAILRALVTAPTVVVLDEPTSHLDSENVEKLIALLQKWRNRGKTIVTATHDRRLVQCADVILYLEDGRLCGEN